MAEHSITLKSVPFELSIIFIRNSYCSKLSTSWALGAQNWDANPCKRCIPGDISICQPNDIHLLCIAPLVFSLLSFSSYSYCHKEGWLDKTASTIEMPADRKQAEQCRPAFPFLQLGHNLLSPPAEIEAFRSWLIMQCTALEKSPSKHYNARPKGWVGLICRRFLMAQLNSPQCSGPNSFRRVNRKVVRLSLKATCQ